MRAQKVSRQRPRTTTTSTRGSWTQFHDKPSHFPPGRQLASFRHVEKLATGITTKRSSSGAHSHLQVGMMSSSASRVQRLHSSCTAVMGCTACARRISSAVASDSPMYLTLPSDTNSFNVLICRGAPSFSVNFVDFQTFVSLRSVHLRDAAKTSLIERTKLYPQAPRTVPVPDLAFERQLLQRGHLQWGWFRAVERGAFRCAFVRLRRCILMQLREFQFRAFRETGIACFEKRLDDFVLSGLIRCLPNDAHLHSQP